MIGRQAVITVRNSSLFALPPDFSENVTVGPGSLQTGQAGREVTGVGAADEAGIPGYLSGHWQGGIEASVPPLIKGRFSDD